MTVTVRPYGPNDASSWDAFVQHADDGTFFHLSQWQGIFQKSFNLVPHYLLAEQDHTITGILPLFHQKSLLFGNALISSPYLVEGAPLAINEESRRALDEAAINLKKQTGASYLEFRTRRATRPDWTSKKGLYATFKRPLHATDQENLLAIPRKQRAVVRKTISGGHSSVVVHSAETLFPIYAESVRNLGTPVFPRKYFERLLKTFPNNSDVVVIIEDGAPVSAVLNFYYKDTVLPYYGGGRLAARKSGANDFLYWEVMRHASAKGYKHFDFGRSKSGTGAFKFKTNWGFEPDWLEYEYFLSEGQSLPEKNPNNPRYKIAIDLWKRLPLPVANFLGPFLIPGLG